MNISKRIKCRDLTVENVLEGKTIDDINDSIDTKADVNDARFSDSQIRRVKKQNAGTGEFTSIAAACASITDSSDTNPYVVFVGPGVFLEPQITVPIYVSVVGLSIQDTIVEPVGDNDLFHLSSMSELSFMTFRNVGTGRTAVLCEDIDFGQMHKISTIDCYTSVTVRSVAADTLMYMEYVDFNDAYTYGLIVESTNGFEAYANAENFYGFPVGSQCVNTVQGTGDVYHIHLLSGAIEGVGTDTGVFTSGAGELQAISYRIQNCTRGIQIENGCNATIDAVLIRDCTCGFFVAGYGLPPDVKISGITFDNCDRNIQVDNLLTTGYMLNTSEYSKTFINRTTPFGIKNKLNNTIQVAKSGGDFTTVAAAIAQINIVVECVTVSGNTTVTSLGAFSPVLTFIAVSGTGIAPGTTATYVDNNTVELSTAANATGTAQLTFVRATQTSNFNINVGPGTFPEPSLVLPEYVTLQGANTFQTRIIATNASDTYLVRIGAGNVILNLILDGTPQTDPDAALVWCTGSLGFVGLNNVILSNGQIGVKIEATTSAIGVFVMTPCISFNTRRFVVVTAVSYLASVQLINCIYQTTLITSTSVVEVTGALAHVAVTAGEFNGLGVGAVLGETGFTVSDGAKCVINAVKLNNWKTALLVDNVGAGPNLIASSINFIGNTRDIQIDNAACTGKYSGHYNTFLANPASTFYISARTNNTLAVAKSGGDYTSLAAAVTSLTPVVSVSTTDASTTITSATGAFTPEYDNLAITGTGIPADATAAFVNNNEMTLSVAATATGTASVTFYRATADSVFYIYVAPGVYQESAFTVPPNVAIVGYDSGTCIVEAANANADLIALGKNNTLRQLTVRGVTGTGYAAVTVDSNQTPSAPGANQAIEPDTLIQNCVFDDNYTDIRCSASVYRTEVQIKACEFTGISTFGIDVDGTSVTSVSTVEVNIYTSYFECASAITCIRAEGPYARVLVSGGGSDGNEFANSQYATISDGADVSILGISIDNMDTGIEVLNAGSGPNIKILGVNIFNSATNDLVVSHPSTTGTINISAEQSRVVINDNSTVSVSYNDLDGGLVLQGPLFLGKNSASLAEVSSLIRNVPAMGVISGGAITYATGLDIDVAGGTGYSTSGTLPDTILNYVTWTSSLALTLPASSTSYIYVDSSGTVQHSTSPQSFTQTVYLGRVRTGTASVEFIDATAVRAAHIANNLDQYNREVFGALYISGSVVTANASREIAVTGGKYYYSGTVFTPAGVSSPGTFAVYRHITSVWTRVNSVTEIPNTYYDDGADPILLTATYYTKHTLYTVGQSTLEQYMLVIGQAEYADEELAIAAPLATPPPYFTGAVIPIATIIVQQGNASYTLIANVKPTPGVASGAGGSGSATLHGSLLGLDQDDHPQYLLADGARALTGALNMNNNNIINAGTVDGVTVSAHASRHLPTGADALTTAAPVTILGTTTTNSTGNANSFARSNHVHAVDLSTFELNALASTTPLSVAKGGTGATAFTSGNFLIGAGTSTVTATKSVPSGNVVGTSDAQTLTNKTITDPTNIILAYSRTANVVAVDKSGNDSTGARNGLPFLTIAAALAAALSGDTVIVMPGTYAENNLSIPVNVTLHGYNARSVVLQTAVTVSTTVVEIAQDACLENVTIVLTSASSNIIMTAVALAAATSCVRDVDAYLTNTTASNVTMYGIRAVQNWAAVAPTFVAISNSQFSCVAASAAVGNARGMMVATAASVNANASSFSAATGSGAAAAGVETNNASALVRLTGCFVSDALQTLGSIRLLATAMNDDTVAVNVTRLTSVATVTRTVTLPDATDTIVARNTVDTLTNKTLTAPTISTILNSGTLTLPATTDTLVARNTTDTLTNKTLTAPTIATILNSGTLTLPAATDTLVARNTTDTLTNKTLTAPTIATITNSGTLTLPVATDTLVARDTTDTLTNKTLTDATVVFASGSDATRTVRYAVSGTSSTATTFAVAPTQSRTVSFPDATDTVVLESTSQTLSNKTLTAPAISTIQNTGTLTLPTDTDTLVGRATTDTLTNKTLTAPTISSITNGGTIIIPSGAGTFATIAAAQTLTNKTLTAPIIATISNTGTLTLPTSTDTLVGRATTDNLTNKTLTAPTISSITNGGTINIPSGAGTFATIAAAQTLTNKTLTAPVISTISNTGTLTLPTTTDTLVGRATTDTLTNKTLTAPTISSITNGGAITIPSGAGTFVTVAAAQTLTNKTLTAPVIASITNGGTITIPAGTDTLATLAAAQTLTNKTLTAPVIDTITNGAATLTLPASSDTLVGRTTADTLTNKTLTAPVIATITNGGTVTIPSGTNTLAVLSSQQTFSNKLLIDSSVLFASNADDSRTVQYTITGTTGTATTFAVAPTQNRTVTFPDATDTVTLLTASQTLTNKTLTAPIIATITNGGTITIPSGAGTFATLAAAQTLTNKTLTAPAISSITNGGTVTIPSGTDTFATLTAAQTFTNKTLTEPTISTIINGVATLTLPISTDTLVGRDTVDTLTNKTLTAPAISTITNSGVVTIPAGTDTLVTLTASQTLTNKTLTAPTISSITNAGTITIPSGASALVTTVASQTLTNKTLTAPVIATITNGAATLTLPATTDTLVGRDTSDTLTNKTLTAPTIATIQNTGTLTLPAATDTLVGRATVDTLTNKTLTAPVITSITNGGTITIPSGAGTFVTLAASQTLTNKTLTAPVISTISNTGTLTLPTATDTLVGRTTTDTLTNKTLTLPTIASISNAGTLTLPATTDTLVARATTDTLTNKTLTLPTISSINNGGTVTIPVGADTFATLAATQTLTNKTLTLPTIASINNAGTVTIPAGAGTFATVAAAQTLTNKTLTAPVIATIVNTGTLTLPTATDTLVARTTTDTLTNKTITDATNTVRATQLATSTADVTISAADAPTTGQALIATGATAANWLDVCPVAIISDVKTTGTNGGSTTNATWVQRNLNTITISAGTWATLGTNTFTLVAGTYTLDATAPSRNVNANCIRLFNITDNATTAVGTGAYTAVTGSGSDASLATAFTITASKTFRIDHYTNVSRATTGFGTATGAAGTPEVYTVVRVIKLA